jgi:4-hydroxy-tetrahydrodipicolinate synthase
MPAKTTGPALFQGAFTALVTPFNDDASRIDFAQLESNIRAQHEGGVAGIVPCGTTGESPTLAEDEHHAVVEKAIEVGKPLGLTVIAGAGSNNTAHAIELHRFAHQAGADASLQVNPYYNKPSQEGLYRHFIAIADSCDLPIVLYNIPGRTGVCLSHETIERLAKHPNIQAIKDATGGLDHAAETVKRTDLAVLSGDDPLTLPMAALGGVGVISVISNIVPDRVAALCRALLTGDWTQAREAHYDLLPLAKGLLSLDTNPVPVKCALKQLGRDTGAVRLPLVPANESVERAVHELLKSSRLINHQPATV